MRNDPSKAEPTSGFSYWAIGIGRDTAAITLFLVFPVGQLLSTRVAPPVVAFCAAAILLPLYFSGHGRQALCHLQSIFSAENDNRATRWFYGFFLLFLVWLLVSLIWSPLRLYGLDDFLVLSACLFLAPILGRQTGRVITFRFDLMFKVGLLIACFAMLLDFYRVTNFHSLFTDRGQIFDLNRTAIFLVAAGWSLLLFRLRNFWDGLTTFALIALIGFTAFKSQSQSAQLAFVAALMALPLLRFWRITRPMVFVMMGIVIFAFPVLTKPIADHSVSVEARVSLPVSVKHRIELWKGYVDLIADKPIFGWGVKADRQLGKSGRAAVYAKEAGYRAHTSSPHNLALELWVNFGLVGVVFFCGALVSLGLVVSKMSDHMATGVTLMAIAAFSAAMFHSSAFQSWLIATMAIVFSIPFAASVIALEGHAGPRVKSA